LDDVSRLSGCDSDVERPAKGGGQQVVYRLQSTSGTPHCQIFGPHIPPSLLIGGNDGALDHEILIVSISRQRFEDQFSRAGMTPSTETAVHSFPFTGGFRPLTPMAPERNAR
jgi:hypothetical protein